MVQLLENAAKLSPRKLYKRIGDLREFMKVSQGVADPNLLTRAETELAQVMERTQLGVDFTVAALIGGTGSGKSTLFNALTGFEFADAGEIRPTTERATACTWRAQADLLLDHLDIDHDRRIEHDSILMPAPDELAGLVLLDLPDYDSVRFTNSLTVSRLLPMLDVLIWVVDPQKYADYLLHRDYLQNLQGRAHQIVVVMNHIDTVLPEQVAPLMEDLRKLLAADGLENVAAYPISALKKTGLTPLRKFLRQAVQTPSTNLITAATQVDQISDLLSQSIGSVTISVAEITAPKEKMVTEIMHASGVPTVKSQILHAGKSFFPVALAAPAAPAHTLCVAIRDAQIAQLTAIFPHNWAQLSLSQIAPAEQLRREIGNIYASVPLSDISRSRLYLALVFALGILIGAASMLWWLPAPSLTGQILAGSFALLLAGGAVFFGKRAVRKAAQKKAAQYQAVLTEKLDELVQAQFFAWPAQVCERYNRAVDLLRR